MISSLLKYKRNHIIAVMYDNL